MTDTPTEEQVNAEAAPEEEVAEVEEVASEPIHCRWCGAQHESSVDDSEDWLCEHCERYQDAMVCPTCHQLARVSMMPPEQVPAAHAPARRKKAKED
jgi:hypothetical protein